MEIEKRAREIRVTLNITRRHGTVHSLSITIDMEDSTVNVPPSGDITPAQARELAKALLLVADLADSTIRL